MDGWTEAQTCVCVQLLREECRDLPWYIYETPPMRKFTARRTLHDEVRIAVRQKGRHLAQGSICLGYVCLQGLVPGAMVHFAFVGGEGGSGGVEWVCRLIPI